MPRGRFWAGQWLIGPVRSKQVGEVFGGRLIDLPHEIRRQQSNSYRIARRRHPPPPPSDPQRVQTFSNAISALHCRLNIWFAFSCTTVMHTHLFKTQILSFQKGFMWGGWGDQPLCQNNVQCTWRLFRGGGSVEQCTEGGRCGCLKASELGPASSFLRLKLIAAAACATALIFFSAVYPLPPHMFYSWLLPL